MFFKAKITGRIKMFSYCSLNCEASGHRIDKVFFYLLRSSQGHQLRSWSSCAGGKGRVGQKSEWLHFAKLLLVERDGDLASLCQWWQEKERAGLYFVIQKVFKASRQPGKNRSMSEWSVSPCEGLNWSSHSQKTKQLAVQVRSSP